MNYKEQQYQTKENRMVSVKHQGNITENLELMSRKIIFQELEQNKDTVRQTKTDSLLWVDFGWNNF